MKNLLYCLLLLICSHGMSQRLVHGCVIDKSTSLPLPYANVGIIGKNQGTLSNLEGWFSIALDQSNSSDSVTVSMLGYKSQSIAVKLIDEDSVTIRLEEAPLLLDDVVIKARKNFRKQHIGWMTQIKDGTLPTDTSKVGASAVMLMETKGAPFVLDYFLLRITYNNKDTFKLRLRVYEVDQETGGPGKDILGRQIFLTGQKRIGWAKVDLRSLKVVIPNQKFFIGVEWIETRENRIEFVKAMETWGDWKLQEHRKGNKKAILTDSVQTVEGWRYNVAYYGDMRDWPGFDDLPPMTAVGICDNPKKKADEFLCYERNSSFATWRKQEWTMGVAIKIRY